MNSIASNTFPCGFSCNGFSEAQHAGFSSRISTASRDSDKSCHRGHIDDRTLHTGLTHDRHRFLGTQKHTRHVDEHLPVVIGKRQLWQRLENGNSGIVNQNIQPAILGTDALDGGIPSRLVGHILLPCLRLAASRHNLCRCLRDTLSINIGDDHYRTLTGQLVGYCMPQARI